MRRDTMSLERIKNEIQGIKGQNINILVNKGRKKIVKYNGIIENIYPSIFTIKILNDELLKNLTCSYNDVLCGDVKIKHN